MKQLQTDSNTLRAELRALPRGSLLLIAERAVELVTQDQLDALVGDFVQIDVAPSDAKSNGAATRVSAILLEEVGTFHHAAIDGQYYEHVELGRNGPPEQSRGTDAFIAEFDRLMRNCVRASKEEDGPEVPPSFWHEVRKCFELLFALLRHIDEGKDDVLAFSDDGSSLDVGVNWRIVLPAYFECLAETGALSPDEFAHAVSEVIAEFAQRERPRYMAAARKAANDAQTVALARLTMDVENRSRD